MLKEFREFVMRGNVMDLAVAVIIGAAFHQIVTSLVNDILMPPIGLLVGEVDFGSLFVNLSLEPYASLAEAQAAGAPTVNYGLFINTVINFLIVAAVIFLLIRTANRLKRQPKPLTPTTQECPFCFSLISLRATRCPQCTSHLKST